MICYIFVASNTRTKHWKVAENSKPFSTTSKIKVFVKSFSVLMYFSHFIEFMNVLHKG